MFDDVDPEYGLHGYKVHVELHDMMKLIMSDQFTGLFCRRRECGDEESSVGWALWARKRVCEMSLIMMYVCVHCVHKCVLYVGIR